MPDDKPVERFGDYEFLDRLAVGGMGELWRVRHVTLGATYVAKLLRPEYREDEEFLKRFFHEAKLVANLRHPNIVQVFGYDEAQALILMEYVEGMDLDALLRSKWELEFKEKRVIAEVVADTIGYAHREHDLIHRDIKPSNVLIAMSRPGMPIQASRIKLTDFGIARVLSTNQRMTMASGMVMGTVHYMAPEQFEGQADKVSDVYSIGVLYYRLLAGRVPFDGPTAFVIRDKHTKEIAPAPHDVDPHVPMVDSQIVMKCLEKDPANRFQDSADLYEALMSGSVEPTARSSVDLHAATQMLPVSPTAGQGGVDATHATHMVEPTQRLKSAAADVTEATLGGAGAAMPTERTIQAAPSDAPMAEGAGPAASEGDWVTERTLRARKDGEPIVRPKAKPRRKLLIAAGTAVALVALLLVGALLLSPRYDIRWDTLRSDPLDTPNGIDVSVSPGIGLGLLWMPAGTVRDTAPPNWSNWTTAFGSVTVRFSDGLFREFVLRCRPADGSAHVDFAGATFEQLAKAHGVAITEDLSRVGDYLNAILVPQNVADAHSLGDLRRCLDRVGDLLARAQNVEFDKTRADTYHGALKSLLEAADALADSRRDEAESHFSKAEGHLQKIEPGDLGQLPDDFLFRQTLGRAITDLNTRADKADRLVSSLDALSDSKANIDYTMQKHLRAAAAVGDYLLFAPGRTAFLKILAKDEAERTDLEAEVRALGENVPPPVAALRRYVAKLDALIAHEPPAELTGVYRAALLELLDKQLTESLGHERPAWLTRCFGAEQLAFAALAEKLWTQVHRARFSAVDEQCRALADERLKAAASLASSDERTGEALQMLGDARACLEAIQRTTHSPEEQKATARGLLSTCCVQNALALFRIGPASASEADERMAAVRRLLDRGLDELAGGDPRIIEDGNTLRHILKIQDPPVAKLAACQRVNFATAGAALGRSDTLFDALAGYQALASQLASYREHPCYRAALKPFEKLQTASCAGYTLPNAAAWWLLAKANADVGEGHYHEAAGHLASFVQAPGQQAPSPLQKLLAAELLAAITKALPVATAFDETAVPAETPRAERWQKLWAARIAAKAQASTEAPADVAPGALPREHQGHEAQWNAITQQLRTLLSHYRRRIAAEEELRRVEAQAGAMAATPAKASAQTVTAALAALAAFRDGGQHGAADDHTARVAALKQQLDGLKGKLVDVADLVGKLLAKDDAKGALDELSDRASFLDAPTALRLTQQATAAWMKAAQADLDNNRTDAALTAFTGIAGHPQTRKHAADPRIAPLLAEAAQATHYLAGVQALAKGSAGFAAALASFQKAAPYRDAAKTAEQLQALQATAKLKKDDPFGALHQMQGIKDARDVSPKIRAAAVAAATEIETGLVAQAAACTTAFNKAITAGDWERYLDTKQVLRAELVSLRDFLEQVEGLDVKQAAAPKRTEIVAGNKVVKFVGTRVLKFRYKLPDGASVPLEATQRIEWTVRYSPPDEFAEQRWLIVNWMEAR